MQPNPPTMPNKPQKGITRLILLVTSIVLFFVFNQPLNPWSALTFGVALLSVTFFEPLYEKIDYFDPWLNKRFQGLKWALSQPLIKISKRMGKRLKGRISRIINLVLVISIIFLIAQNFLTSTFHYLQDYLCVETQYYNSDVCGTGIGVEYFQTNEGDTLTIGLENASPTFTFDGSHMKNDEKQVNEKIWVEDKEACHKSHITLAVVSSFSRTADDNKLSANVGVEELKGAYIAQEQYNRSSQHQTKLCLVIANFGTELAAAEAVPSVVKQLSLYSKSDRNFRGIIGFPFSTAASAASKALSLWPESIPIVSSSAMADTLSNKPYFYRVVSSNRSQSQDILDFFIKTFKTREQSNPVRVAVFRGSKEDPYTSNLATDFKDAVDEEKPPPNIDSFFEDYQDQDPSSLKGPLQDALKQGADAIFFPGYAYDLDSLQNQLQAIQQQQGSSSKNIPIIGGEGIYGIDRYIASNPSSLVYSAVYASPVGADDPFAQEYTHEFGPELISSFNGQSYSLLPPHAVLSYEATSAFLQALDQITQQGGDLSQNKMNNALGTVSFHGPTFDGQSDSIAFQDSTTQISNPVGKKDYILCTDKDHHLRLAAEYTPGLNPVFHLTNGPQCY